MNLSNDQLNFLALIISALSATAAKLGLYLSAREQKTNVKEDFLLWAMERLRKDDLRKYRAQIFALTDKELGDVAQAIRDGKPHPAYDPIS